MRILALHSLLGSNRLPEMPSLISTLEELHKVDKSGLLANSTERRRAL